jgi:hypothetical protein
VRLKMRLMPRYDRELTFVPSLDKGQDPEPNPLVRLRQLFGSALAQTLDPVWAVARSTSATTPSLPDARMHGRRRWLDKPFASILTGVHGSTLPRPKPRPNERLASVGPFAIRRASAAASKGEETDIAFSRFGSHRLSHRQPRGAFRGRPAHSHTLVTAMERGETLHTDAPGTARAAPGPGEGRAIIATKPPCATIPRRGPGLCRRHRREIKGKR